MKKQPKIRYLNTPKTCAKTFSPHLLSIRKRNPNFQTGQYFTREKPNPMQPTQSETQKKNFHSKTLAG